MNDKTQSFKSATNKITSLRQLFTEMDKIKHVYFEAHFDPFESGQDFCGFLCPPNSEERSELSEMLSNVGIGNNMVGQMYIVVKPENANIARKLFTDYVRGHAPTASMEQAWNTWGRTQKSK